MQLKDIKYRAYDLEKKKWINLWRMYFSKEGCLMNLDTVYDEFYCSFIDVMRYIGRNDGNGNEIWDGDIITTDLYAGLKGVVVRQEKSGFYPFSDFYWLQSEDFIKIGNKYDNPELIKR